MSDLCLLATMVAKLQTADQPLTTPDPVVTTAPNPRQRPALKTWTNPNVLPLARSNPSSPIQVISSDRLKQLEAEFSQTITTQPPGPTDVDPRTQASAQTSTQSGAQIGTQIGTQIGAQIVTQLLAHPNPQSPTPNPQSSPCRTPDPIVLRPHQTPPPSPRILPAPSPRLNLTHSFPDPQRSPLPRLAQLVAYQQSLPTLRPRSGAQLYVQRLASLRQGRLYTRLPMDSFATLWQTLGSPTNPGFHPNYSQWKRLLALEARAAAKGQGSRRLSIVLGDSLSQWMPMQQLPKEAIWLNQGISGDTTRGVLQRLSAFRETRPDSIYVLAGINDLKRGASDGEVLVNLRQIMSRLRQQHPQTEIVVQSLLPNAVGISNARIRNLNQQLARMAQEQRVSYLDLYAQFADNEGELLADLSTDGLHLNDYGYAVWQSVLQNMQSWIALNQGSKLWG